VIVDTNVSLSRWPFRRLVGDEPAELVARLRKQNVGKLGQGVSTEFSIRTLPA